MSPSAEVKEVLALLQVQRPQVVLEGAPCEVLAGAADTAQFHLSWLQEATGEPPPGPGVGGGLCRPVKWSTMNFCPSANSGEAGRRQGPERTAAGTACTTGPGGHQRGGPCLLALPLCRRWLTLPGGTRNGMRLTGNASAVRPGQTHLPSTHPPLCRGQEWEEAPQTETASQNHQQLALSHPLWPLSSPPLQWSEGRDPGSLDALSCPVCRLWPGCLLSCVRPQQVSRNAFQTCPAPQHLLKKLLRTHPGTVVDPSLWPLAGHRRDRALPSQSSVLGPSRRNRSLAVPPTPTTSESITPPTTVVTQMMLSLE